MRITVDKAATLLNQGHIVAIPTETVYGMAANALNENAVAKIYSIKKRPQSNPLIVHVSSYDDLKNFVLEPPPQQLCDAFWPGPMTLVLPVDTSKIPNSVRAGLTTCAFRIPSHPLAQETIKKAGPLVMPSANLSGRPSATQPDHIEADFGEDFPVVDGGPCTVGLESTILFKNGSEWVIIREGALSPADFEPYLGYQPKIQKQSSAKPICPGQMFKHYSPKAKLFLDTAPPPQCQAILGFVGRKYPIDPIILGSLDNPEEIARNLYRSLRLLDEQGIESAWIDFDFPKEGILKTVAERLQKAASAC